MSELDTTTLHLWIRGGALLEIWMEQVVVFQMEVVADLEFQLCWREKLNKKWAH